MLSIIVVKITKNSKLNANAAMIRSKYNVLVSDMEKVNPTGNAKAYIQRHTGTIGIALNATVIFPESLVLSAPNMSIPHQPTAFNRHRPDRLSRNCDEIVTKPLPPHLPFRA